MKHQNRLFVFLLLLFVSAQMYAQPDADKPVNFKDQVFLDDVIVDGSLCVGFDCVNGEVFGFKTLRLKENNLRIHFDDTSTSASFPSSDWCIQINDTTNGGANYYGIVHENTGRRVFSLEANAPSHSLYVDDGGRVGLGTSTPVVELHVKDGDSPTLRLEQDGSNGFTPQTWDVAGNETNFFVRDVTNGSRLPLRIRPQAPTNSIFVDTDGDVGMGTSSPDENLEVESQNGAAIAVKNLTDGSNAEFIINNDNGGGGENDAKMVFNYSGTGEGELSFVYEGSVKAFINGTNNGKLDFGTGNPAVNTMRLSEVGRLGIGETAPTQALHVVGDAFKTVGGNTWAAMSDRRLKNNVNEYKDGLEQILKINPVKFRYNGDFGFDPKEEVVGIIAQEMKEIAPYMVYDVELAETKFDANGEERITKKGTYLGYKGNALQYMLVNAIKDQHELIQNQDARIEELEKSNDELRSLVMYLKDAVDQITLDEVELNGQLGSFVKQNVPNPFEGQTKISYRIADNASNASIQFSDVTGKIIKSFNITSQGDGVLTIKAVDLPHGTYSYSLVVDNQLIETVQMVKLR